MQRRGPDGSGVAMMAGICLLHARLAVIDPEGGQQPMQLRTPKDCFTIVYNGELYNVPELRLELEKLGHTFLGHSDTEILLHSYAQWGKEAVKEVQESEIAAFLAECSEKDSEMFVALYADETVPYREVVKVLDIANENKYRMVLATRRPDSK